MAFGKSADMDLAPAQTASPRAGAWPSRDVATATDPRLPGGPRREKRGGYTSVQTKSVAIGQRRPPRARGPGEAAPRMSVPTPPRRPPSAASSRPRLRASPAVPCASRGPKPGALAPSTPQRPAPCSAQLGVRLFQTNVISPLSEYWSSDCHRTPIPHRMPLSPRPLSRPHGREPQAHARPCPPSPSCPSTSA